MSFALLLQTFLNISGLFLCRFVAWPKSCTPTIDVGFCDLSKTYSIDNHVTCVHLPRIWILYSSSSLILSLSMIAIWNQKHHSQQLYLSALALQIRTASRKVTCLLWGIKMVSLSARIFYSQAPKSNVSYCCVCSRASKYKHMYEMSSAPVLWLQILPVQICSNILWSTT